MSELVESIAGRLELTGIFPKDSENKGSLSDLSSRHLVFRRLMLPSNYDEIPFID